jgi:hypothetical protein
MVGNRRARRSYVFGEAFFFQSGPYQFVRIEYYSIISCRIVSP